jgi:threonine/homoserine/homoserine lactone efflux protein
MGESMDLTALATFAAAFLFFAASPGPDNVTIVARTIAQGAVSGIAYGAGTCTGILLFLCLAVFGLSVVASEMGAVMTILRYAGAVYLIWTGIRLWTAEPIVPELDARPTQSALGSYLTGVLLNLGNPKMPLFYIALLPNVVGTELTAADGAMLASVILVIEVVVVGGHVMLATRARQALRSPAVVRRANRAAGTVMIGAGAAVVAVR